MGATNATTNLELSQFIGSDSPKWLTDYNGDMEKIDAGYGVVKAQADATDLVVSGHTSSISSLTTTTGEQTTSITNLRTDVNTNTGSINTITSLIGNGEPTTTDKTLIGGINELDSEHGSLVTALQNKNYTHFYQVVTAASITADGVKTRAQILNELHAQFQAYISNLADNIFVTGVAELLRTGQPAAECPIVLLNKNSSIGNRKFVDHVIAANGDSVLEIFQLDSSDSHQANTVFNADGVTYYNNDNYVVSNGTVWSIEISLYTANDPVLS